MSKKIQYYLQSYFKGEKQQSLFFTLGGILAITLGALGYFYFQTAIWLGTAIPFISIGLIQLVVGASVYFRTNGQVKKLLLQSEQETPSFFKEEIARMEKVLTNFSKYKTVLILFFCLGFLFLMLGAFGGWGKFTSGSGAALLWQSGTIYLMDSLAEYRAEFYIQKLKKFSHWNSDLVG